MSSFGQRLKQARLQNGLTQSELAKKCGWKFQNRVSEYESNSRKPSVEDLASMSKSLFVSTDFLILGKNTETNNSLDFDLVNLMKDWESFFSKHKKKLAKIFTHHPGGTMTNT